MVDKELNMEKTWYTVRTTHVNGLRTESRRFGADSIMPYVNQCIKEHGPLLNATYTDEKDPK